MGARAGASAAGVFTAQRGHSSSATLTALPQRGQTQRMALPYSNNRRRSELNRTAPTANAWL